MTGPALPLFGLGLSLNLIGWCIRNRTDHTTLQQLAPLAIWSVFGLSLLAKMFLNSRLAHYRFALAVPATLMVVVGLVGLGSLGLSRRYQRGGFYCLLLAALIITDIAYYLTISFHFYRNKTFPVGRGADAFMAFRPDFDPRSGPRLDFCIIWRLSRTWRISWSCRKGASKYQSAQNTFELLRLS